MKITPLEIRQKTFEKKLRGYDKDEVAAFLQSLSQEWEQVQDEIKELRLRNDAAEKEIKQLREVENSLFKTLKTAEDTGANMIDQATKTAELHMRETQMSADALLNEAKTKARGTIDASEARARNILDKMDQDLQTLKLEYRSLENLRDIIIAELRNLSNDTLGRVDKIEAKAAQDASAVKERMAETAAAIAQESDIIEAAVDNVVQKQKKEAPPAQPSETEQVKEVNVENENVTEVEEKTAIDWTDTSTMDSPEEGVIEEKLEATPSLDESEEVSLEETIESDSSKQPVEENTNDAESLEEDGEDSSFFDQIK